MTEPLTKKQQLEEKLKYYEDKLAFRMKRYRGVIHESAASEMKHQEVMVLKAMVADLKRELLLVGNSGSTGGVLPLVSPMATHKGTPAMGLPDSRHPLTSATKQGLTGTE